MEKVDLKTELSVYREGGLKTGLAVYVEGGLKNGISVYGEGRFYTDNPVIESTFFVYT
jgi:hypothetical protein